MKTFEQEIQELEEQFRQNVEKRTREFNRDIKRYLIIGGAVVVALGIIQAVILWLLPGK